ncbi:hypothetical protein [Faecalitalea cylindroides]|uniref:hypothetical protein n=1 Tax=Faecalitalea cylindroides TaxID=39483 RepID=UPI0024926E86|nr:hypothetical protein [Faecalitalea cylindroides]
MINEREEVYMDNVIKKRDVLIDKGSDNLYLVLNVNENQNNKCCYLVLTKKPRSIEISELSEFLNKLESGEMLIYKGDLVQKEYICYETESGEVESVEVKMQKNISKIKPNVTLKYLI